VRQQLPGGVWPDDPARWRDGEPKGRAFRIFLSLFAVNFNIKKSAISAPFNLQKTIISL
jgi:hypothetical protein